jgi:hypothetical protein
MTIAFPVTTYSFGSLRMGEMALHSLYEAVQHPILQLRFPSMLQLLYRNLFLL